MTKQNNVSFESLTVKQQYFSVIIPLFNKKDYIKRTIDSVLSQTYQHFEIIIINDGSSDGGDIVAKTYSDKRIKVIGQENNGVSAARNKGISASKYEFVCLLDADDEWRPLFLEEMAKLLNDYPDHHIFSLRHEIVDDLGELIYPKVKLKKGYRGVVKNFTQLYSRSNGLINASSVCLRKQYFLQLGGFPASQNQGEDIYLWLTFDLNTDLVFYDAIGSRYYRNASNRSIDRLTLTTLPFHFSHFYKKLGNKSFLSAYGNTKKIYLNKYLRRQALFHIAKLTSLNKKEVAASHTNLLYSLNKSTGVLCYLITLIPSPILNTTKVIRDMRRR